MVEIDDPNETKQRWNLLKAGSQNSVTLKKRVAPASPIRSPLKLSRKNSSESLLSKKF